MQHTTVGNDIEFIRRDDISKCLFRFGLKEDVWQHTDARNGLEQDEQIILRFSRVADVSLVTFPAYPTTETSVRHLEERKVIWQKICMESEYQQNRIKTNL